MNKLKLTLAGIICAAIACISIGCKTVVTTDPSTGGTVTNKVPIVNPDKTAKIIDVVVPPLVQFAVGKDPNCKGYLQAVAIAISVADADGQYSPEKLKATLNAITVNELHGPEAQAAVEAAIALYQAFAGEAVAAKINASGYDVVLQALSNDIMYGLSLPPITLSTAP